MIWLFMTTVLVLTVFHPTFRRVVGWLTLAAVALAVLAAIHIN